MSTWWPSTSSRPRHGLGRELDAAAATIIRRLFLGEMVQRGACASVTDLQATGSRARVGGGEDKVTVGGLARPLF
jgi:hypothetical protein